MFQESIDLMDKTDNPSQVVPSDYGAARGLCAIQYLFCCCFTYCPISHLDGRTFKYYSKARERILHEENCPLFILDNSSIQEYICEERRMIKDAKLKPRSAPSTAANSPRSVFGDDAASGDEGLLCLHMSEILSSDGFNRVGYRSATDDYERSEPILPPILPSNAEQEIEPAALQNFLEIDVHQHTPSNPSAFSFTCI